MSHEPAAFALRRRIAVLIIVLGTAGFISKLTFAWNHGQPPLIPAICHLGIVVAELMLLGIWCAMGSTYWPTRVSLWFIGCCAVWAISSHEYWQFWLITFGWSAFFLAGLLIFLPAIAIVLACVVVRIYRAQLHYVGVVFRSAPEPLQYVIRHLLIATAAAAVLLTLGMGKGVREFYHLHASENASIGMFAAILSVGFPRIAVTAISACLRNTSSVARFAMLALAALVVVLLPSMFVPFNFVGASLYVGSTLVASAMVIASLLIVRSCGYRLLSLNEWLELLVAQQANVRNASSLTDGIEAPIQALTSAQTEP